MKEFIYGRFEFRNIGQGMFYTGQIEGFNFVYDCGSDSGKKMIKNAINEYKREFFLKPGIKGNLNMLVLSHFDNDHVNGVTDLLNNFHIHTVVIPYLYPIERLRLIAKYKKANKEYRNLLKDPIEYFASFSVKQIILLDRHSPSNHDPILHDNIIDTSDSPNLDIDNIDLLKAFDELPDSEAKEEIKTIENLKQISKKIPIKIKKRGSVKIGDIWEFLFFNYDYTPETLNILSTFPTVDGKSLYFKQDLLDLLANKKARKIKQYYNDMIKKLKNSKNIKNINNTSIILNHIPINYEQTGTHINLNEKRKETDILPKNQKSMSAKKINSLNSFRCFKKSSSYKYFKWSCFSGTLLFGDIDTRKDLNQITNFFGYRLQNLSIISVPHHGSKYNWDPNLFKIFNTNGKNYQGPVNWVVSCGLVNKFGHPDYIVFKNFMPNRKNQLFINNEINEIKIQQIVLFENRKASF